MTNYIITDVQCEQVLQAIRMPHGFTAEVKEMLQSLPMVSGEPVAYRLVDPDFAKKHHYFDLNEVEPVKHVLEPLYTSPHPLQPISANDVTDEMIDELAKQCPTYNTVEVDRQIIAASVNIYDAVIKHRSETNGRL